MRYLFFEIYTEEPVKMSGQTKAEETQGSLDYITGSSIRGAMIGQYEKVFQTKLSEKPELKRKLLKEVRFLNAYPIAADPQTKKKRRTLPAPMGFLAEKKKLDTYDGSRIHIKSLFHPSETGTFQEDRPCAAEPFVCLSEDTVYGVTVEKEFQLHISVNASKIHGQERAMFRYEAILPGQSFCGAVITKEGTLAEQIKELIKTGSFYLGGSRGSGYGKVRMKLLEEMTTETDYRGRWEKGQRELFLYYLSDAVIYDSYGNLSGHVPVDLLETNLGIKNVRYEQGMGKVVSITGYNSVWRAAMPQMTGIKAGTVQRYSFDGGDITQLEEKIQAFQEKGVGERRQEGYGRILILSEGFQQKYWQGIHGICEQPKTVSVSLGDKEKAQAEFLLGGIYRQQVLRRIDRNVVETAKNLRKVSLTPSQLGKLQDLFAKAEYEDIQDMKAKVEKYFANMKDKRTPKAFYQYQDTHIGNKSFYEYIKEFMYNCDKAEVFTGSRRYPVCDLSKEVQYRPDRKEVFRYNMLFMKKFLQYLLRDKKEEE